MEAWSSLRARSSRLRRPNQPQSSAGNAGSAPAQISPRAGPGKAGVAGSTGSRARSRTAECTGAAAPTGPSDSAGFTVRSRSAAPATVPPATRPGVPSDLADTWDERKWTNSSASAFSTQPGLYGSLEGFSSGGIPVMIGDLGAIPSLAFFQQGTGQSGLPSPFPPPRPPSVPRARGASMVIPSMRGVKISDNQSPRPQDRVYFSFNYFQGVNDQVNQKIQAPIGYTQVFRYIGGVEKTFFDGQGSIGIQAPLNSVTATSTVPKQFGNYGGTSTAVGDMSVYAKYILLEDRQTGNLLSGGLAICPPTGPGRFAGLNSFASITNTTSFQPFIGYIYTLGGFMSTVSWRSTSRPVPRT